MKIFRLICRASPGKEDNLEKVEIEKQNHISVLNHLSENQSFKINKNVYLPKKKLRLNKLSNLFKDTQ